MSDIQQTADKVFRRDRRRIRALALVAIGLWVLGAMLIFSVYLPLGAKIKKYAVMLHEANPGMNDRVLDDRATTMPASQPAITDIPAAIADVRRQHWIVAQIVFHEWIIGAIILVFALGTGILASAATVALAITIRSVTLRQVNESLAQIAEQLRQLQTQKANGT